MILKCPIFRAAILLLLICCGCIARPINRYIDPLPRTKEVFVGETLVFKDSKYAMKGIEDFGKPADQEPYYQEVIRTYQECLSRELQSKGFIINDTQPNDNSLIIKSKIADYPVSWFRVPSLGVIGVKASVYYKGELILEIEESVNTSPFHSPGLQIKRGVAPRLADKLKKVFLSSSARP